jgi:hypothetical protein
VTLRSSLLAVLLAAGCDRKEPKPETKPEAATAPVVPEAKPTMKPTIETLTKLIDTARTVKLVEGSKCSANGPLRVLVVDTLTLERGPVDFIWGSLESTAINYYRDYVAKKNLEAQLGDVGAGAAAQRTLAALPSSLPDHFLVIRTDERTGKSAAGKFEGKARGHAFVVDAATGALRCAVPFERSVTADVGGTVQWREVPPDVYQGRTWHMILPSTLEAALTSGTRDAIKEALAKQGLAIELL